MKRQIAMVTVLMLLVSGFVISGSVLAQSKTETYLGETEMCLEVPRIKETRILDDQTILFIMRDGGLYLNRFPVKCSGLYISGGFSYRTSIAKLCKQDSITVVGPGMMSQPTCLLGDFRQFKTEMKFSDTYKLLKDGLLDELAAEGAFQEVFPKKE